MGIGNIKTSSEINGLALSPEAKQRAKNILHEKGAEAVKKFLLSESIYTLENEHIVKVMKEIYSDETPEQIQKRVEHMEALIESGCFKETEKSVSINEGMRNISCSFCGERDRGAIQPVCNACLEEIREGKL